MLKKYFYANKWWWLPERGGEVDRLREVGGVSANVAVKTLADEEVRRDSQAVNAGWGRAIHRNAQIHHLVHGQSRQQIVHAGVPRQRRVVERELIAACKRRKTKEQRQQQRHAVTTQHFNEILQNFVNPEM